ncbi:LPD38 domain-containing protein [Muribaculum intestinale]|uniref:LPD38 domain-containing protein n=1 Tax=Muribaculum intestinale TaxID=1796646 RepID=UPI002674F35A|nr:LPD38 domain-containing protein [Muribaculum intestinale]
MAKEANESTKWLYEQLKGKGYNVGKDVNEFDRLMRTNADSRQWAYDTATKSGLNVGKDIDEFSSLVGGTSPSSPVADLSPATTDSTAEVEPTVENKEQEEGWKPTPMQKAFMMGSVQSSLNSFKAHTDASMERLKNTSEYYNRGGAFSGNKPVKGDMRYNEDAGKIEQTYLTPTGTATADKFAAERETRAYNDYVDNMTVSGQLRRAGRDLSDLHRKREERVKAIHDKWAADQKNNKAPLAAVLGAQTYVPSIQSDPEYRALTAAIHQAEKRVQTLQHENDRQDGKDVGFWRGFGEVVGDIKTWDFGYSGLMDAMTMLDATSKPSPNRPAKTDAQKEAEQIMLEQTYEAQQAQSAYGQNDSFWNRAGVMTGEMLPFMLDFAIMGGAKGGTSMVTRNLDAVLLRSLHKAAPKIARNKAVQWTTKALGAMPEDLLYRAPLMTNTVQGMKTASDIIDRKLGDVVIRDDGTYDFSNDKTWGSAVWQGEANAIIENYSEMFGTHLEGVLSLKTVGKLADTFGAKRLSGILTKASNSELAGIAGTMQKHLNQLGVSDYFGEVGEEYYGQLWRTMLNLDDAYKQNPDGSRTNLFLDGQFHGDIWGGMALSMGLMGAGKYSISAAAYGSMKHRVNKTDTRASEIFTPEIWNGWRERIDGTTNDKIGEIAEAIVADPTLTDEQRTAAMNYMEASLNLRGFNLASVARQRGGEMSEDEAAANESYMDGYTASTPQEMNDAKKMLDLQHGRLASALSEDLVQSFDNDPIGALSVTHDPELRRIASDYVNAKMVYDGMIQRVRDDVDGRIAQSNAMIDSRINRETGMIQPATMKADDRRVYIVNGTVAMFEDGTGVDTNNSSESIIIRDAETGKVEFADPTQFHSVDEAVDAGTEKEAARAQIIDEIAVAAANNIDGVLSFTPGESYSVLDLDGNPEDIAILGQPTDENGIPLDGYVDIQYPDGTIQSVATSDLQQWVDAANTRRVEQFDAERQAERAKYESNSISLQENQSEYGNGSEQNNDERADARQDDGGSVVADTTGIVEGDRDRSDIRVYEEGLATSRDEYSEYSERTRRNSEAERLIGIARQRGQYVDRQKYDGLGERHSKRTGESEVYINKAEGKVYKIKNPAAKSPMKGGVQPEDAIYEHLVHNKYFPETRYQFEGISDDIGDLRIVLSQGYIDAVDNATNEQIEAALAEKGLYPEGNYRYGDNEVSVTDVTGDNALLGADGKVYFIDPIIDFKKPIREIIGDGETDDGVPERTPPSSALSRVPLNEKGKPDFGAVDADTAWDAIVEKTSNEAMAQSFADNMVAASEAELKKAEKVKTKPTTDLDEFIAADSERIANIDRAKTALDHWKKVAGTKQRRQAEADAVRSAEMRKRAEEARVKAEQERAEREEAERWEAEKRGLDKRLRDTAESVRHVPEAVEVLKDMNPQSMDEVAAWLLSRHKVIWSDTKRGGVRIKYGVASHTGFGEGERRKLFGLFASAEKGGISLDRLSEDLFKEACDVFGVAYDNKSARDALIERIGEARTMGDIRNYIANNRIARATRVAAEFDAYEAEQREEHYQEAYHMGYDEYEAYEEQLLVEKENAFRNFDEQEFYGNIADELVNQQRYGLRSNEEAVGEREVAADGGGVEVLSGTESGEAGGAPGDVVGQEVSGGAGYALRDTSGGLPEGASRGLDGPGGGVVDAGVRISADDLAKLGERDRRDVEDYLSRRWSCDVGVIGDVRDIESLPENSRADIVDAYEDGETWAIYSRGDKKIYIFAGKNGDESLSGVLLHENVHAVVDMLGDDCREFLEAYAGQISALPYTNGVFGGMYADIQDLYAEDKAEEEFLAYSLQYVELYNKVLTKIKKSLDEPTLRYLEDKILSKLYEPAGRTDKGEAVHDNSRVQWSRVQEDNGLREREPHEISGGASGERRESGWESEAGGQSVGERYESTEEYPGRVAEGKAVQDNSRAQHARVQETVVDTEGGLQGGGRRELGEGGERGDKGIAEEAEIASEEDALNSRIEVKDDDWTEGGGYTPTLKRTVVIDGTHNVIQVDAPNDKGDYTGSIFEYDGKTFGDLREVISYIDSSQPATIGEQIAEAEAEVNTNPTDGQKKAGNYKKGHVQVGTFDVTIENPKGSKRSGTDADGKKWETTMTHTYGYICGTQGVDGDHIDVYISSDIDGWNGRKVFVVDQYNPDGSFDEHKVMLGFNDKDEAFEAYLSNYEAGWENGRRLDVTAVNLDDFEKWIESSKRKTKAFTEYAGVKVICPVCGKAGIPNYHNHDVVCPQCNSDLSVFRQIDQLSENEKQELSDKFIGEDNQGNLIDHAGKLIVEDVTSIDDITDEDFVNPTRTIGLPKLPNAVSDAIGSKNKRVIIKKNIFGKNHKNHKELTPSESREILRTALYTPSLYGRNQKQTRPYNWILIHLADKSTCVLLEVDNSKENCEIVNWHYLSGETLARKKRQAIKEGGRILTLSENNVAADTHDGLPSDDKGNTLSTDKQTESAESSDGYTIEPRKDTRDNSDIFAVKFEERVSREVFKGQNAIAKKHGGYWSNFGKKGFLFKTREDAEAFANEVIGKDKTQLSEEAPLSIDDMQSAIKSAFEETPTDKEEISSSSEETTAEKKDVNPSGNKLVTDEQYAKLLAKMRKKMGGQLNMGVDPEILAIGSMMAVYHIEKGARKFAEYVKAMVADLGEKFPARYLKGFYKAAHEMIEDAAPEIAVEMDSDDVVNTADVASIISGRIDAMATAEMVVEEETAEQEREEAERKLKDERNVRLNPDGSTSETVIEGGVEIEVTKGDFIPGVRRNNGKAEWTGQTEEPKKKKSQKKTVSSQSEQPGLFGGLFDEDVTPTDNDIRRNDAVSTERLPSDNRGQSEGNSENPRAQSQGTRQGSERTDRAGEESGAERTRTVRPRLSRLNENERRNTKNNRAERGTDYAPKSEDARIRANIAAIELAQRLIESGEQATPEDMQWLRMFSGWGGLGKAFTNNAYADRIRKLLGDSYQDAVDSRKSAYYTPAAIIDFLWDIAKAMGFQGGTILEGSAGIGNILGLMPDEISERSEIRAVEVDSTTGSILSLLYPDAQVDIQGFEETKIENGSIDLAITNVPFITGWNVIDKTGDKDLSKKFKDIHDFCIAKNIRKLREGGIGIFITSSGTLDNSAKLRAWVTNEGNSDVVGAFRLHNETFGGTGATSDIIVVRKRVNGKKSAHAIDVSEVSGVRTAEYDTGETKKVKVDGHKQEVPVVDVVTMDYNRYFVEHPEHMAGEMHFGFEKGDTYRAKSKALYPVKGMNQEAMLSAWAQSFSDMDFDAAPSNKNEYETTYDTVGNEVKVGSMVIDDRGRLCVNTGGLARPLMSVRKNKQDTRTDDELISMFNSKKIKGRTRQQCLKDYNGIKKALADVLEYQTTHEDNEGLEPLLSRLNATFDSFVSRYGNLHKNNQLAWLRNDVDYPGILALERYEERGDESGNRIKKFGKTDIFSRRVVEKETIPQPKNVKDGIITSLYISGRVDVGYISEQLGISDKQVREEIVSSGLGFENPVSREMEVSYEYLSGNVREKLRQATANNTDGKYDTNIKALEKVVPMNIPAHLIEFALGSSWIEPKLYEDYVKERTGVDVNLTNVGGTWFMKTSGSESNTEQNRSQGVYSEELKKTVFGHEILEAAITNRSISVSRTYKRSDGTYETVTDRDATQAVAAKVDEFRIDFKDWARAKMQGDMEMSARMETVYNDRFNNSVPRSIPDEFIPKHFGGQVTEMGGRPFSLRPHQAKAVIRGTTQSQLLAHEVGTGKTFTLISTAMEMRRLGTARKPMIVVQNATVGQFVESAKALYPNAKVLTLEDADRNAQGRKDFYAKIRYNDWDMIVIPQSVLDMIPDSEERQIRFIQDKIAEKMLVLQQMAEQDPDGSSWITKQAEKEISDLENDLAKITESLESKRKEKSEKDMKKEAQTRHNAEVRAMEMLDRTTDDVENFDQMGIDALLVDEAHEYKHLGFATAMQRGVKGVDPSYSKKAQGLYLKTQAVMERNRGRNVIFATGTPISNTAAEIWTFMRYLMPEDEMRDYGIYYFDDFVRNFGNLQQMLEFATNGKFKENNRFAGYVNLPELVRIWSTVTDIVLTREAEDVSDKIPDMEGGKAQDIYLPQTKALRSVMLYVKSELDRYDKMTGKEKKANSHIPLTMYGIAKAAAVDARLVYSDAADEPQSKTNEAVRQTLRSLEETSDYKGTVAIFADNYQNKQSGFNLYEDIRRKLIEQGVPAEQIVVMKSGMTVKKKLEIFDKVNAGEVRVILGSTYTLGTGVNIQERLHTLIHLDAPNRPMDYTQRNGRILRQGNLHKDMGLPVRVLRFGVEDSLDVTAYQRLKTKGAIADSIMNGSRMMENSMETRSLEEDEDVFGDITAQLSGSEYAMLKNQAEKEVRKLNSKLKQWEADQTYIHNQIPRLKGQIRESEKRQKTAQENLDVVRRIFPNGTFKTITIGKQTFSDLESMNKLFTEHNKSVMDISDQIRDNKISGPQTRKLTIDIDGLKFEVTTVIDKEMGNNGGNLFSKASRKITYSCPELPGVEDVPVSGARLKGAVEDIVSNLITGKDYAEMVDVTQSSIDRNQTELKQIEQRKDKEFEYYDELAEAKERLEEYTEKMKAELAEKEAKYADMDADVEVATDITLSEEDSEETEDEELLRDGYGAYSDAEVSMENDPWSKAWGESIRSKRQQKQFAERERNRMRERVEALSSVLGIDIEVIEDASSLKGKKQRAKGWYDTKTGKITVVVGNHNSAADMEATILHEAVAHHGLRQLLGEHFDEFLDKVYEAAENGIKEQIDLLASRNGWNRRVATEEYLAGFAEQTDFDRAEERVGGWFDKIKRFFIDMLFKAGFKHIKPGSIGDNELRYILWRSYQNLAHPGRYRAFEWEAEDVAMQHKLQVGQYDTNSEKVESAADSGIRFRDGDFTPRDRKLAADVYEKMLSRGSWQFREATQDSMLGLKTLYESILGSNTRIENVAGHENAYLYENRMSSANNGEQHQYFSRFMKPLLESIHKLCGSKELDRRILTDYMMAKHGLERNEYMRNEAAANGEDTERDFAGLCGLTGEDDWQVAETVAQQMVDDYEADHNTAELWNNVKKATNATLEKIYLSGLISEDTYNKVLGMYDFYIPLRGWDETTSDEVYGYLTSKDGPLMGSVFKTAEGRDSKADDPIATIAMMADDAIRQGNRNIMKQRFLNFVHGNPSDLVSVNEMWLQHNDVTDEWEPVFADLQPDMTHAEVESEIAKFEVKMETLRTAEPDKYKKGGDARNIPYKVVRGNLNEHQVLVKRNGRTYVMTINGNPRAAQALNGLTNPDTDMGGVYGKIIKGASYVNRQLSAFYTTRNPDFVVSNFLRDMLYSNCMTWVKENPRYALRFHKNFGKVNPLTLRKLLSKWENDNLSDSNYLEKMFKEFMLNGGETGYTSVKDIDGHKRTIAKELKKISKRDVGHKTWYWLGGQLDLLNRSVENCARFAAFVTSREMGRTLDRSIHDAKEVSVNFNKKGSGDRFIDANGQTALGKTGGYLGGVGRSLYVFWNAGIQGMTNFGRAGVRNPKKAIGGAAALFTLGYVIPLLAQMLGGGDGDDDDKNAYYNLPEYVRRSNICFKAGEQWITIPLPIEYRAIYGMGELACGVISGNERYSNSELAYYIAAQVSQVMPLDFLEGANPTSHDGFSAESLIHPFIPSAFKPFTEAYIMNKGWTGLPIAKDSPFNKYEPEWKRVYQSSDQHLVEFSRWLNQTTGGNDYKKGILDINPAKLEYLLSGTFGGVVSTTGKLKKMGETALGTREFEWRNMLLANRVIKSGDERTANRKLQNEYFKYKNEAEKTEFEFKGYRKDAAKGILEAAQRVNFLYNSDEFLRYQIFKYYEPALEAIREQTKEAPDETKKQYQEMYYSRMRELVDALHEPHEFLKSIGVSK